MEPLAIAAYLLLANAALCGVMGGAIGGAIAWAMGRNPFWSGLLFAAAYLLAVFLFESYSLKAAVVFGLPAFVMTFIVSWLSAWWLHAKAGWRPIWALLAAAGCAAIGGFLWGFLFRLDIWAPVVFAVAADVVLVLLLLLRNRLGAGGNVARGARAHIG